MRKLNIEITKAQLVSFTVNLKEGQPEMNATIALMTEGGKVITNYTIYSHHYQDDLKFELPMTAIKPIRDIMDILEAVVVKHCNSNMKMLEGAVHEM